MSDDSTTAADSGFQTVGWVKDAHGIRGELFIQLRAKEAAWLPRLKTLRLQASATSALKQVKEFSVHSARLHKGGLIIRTKEIKDRNQAEELRGAEMQIPTEFLQSAKGEAIYLIEIQGFMVVANGHEIGPIRAFSSNGAQDLLLVDYAGREVAIPFVEAFVEKMDFSDKRILMNLPEGLLQEDAEKSDEPQ